jgi:DNA (cytosine-5)-methyltransferase 1
VSKPRLLDLFCGAGGAAVGYSRAGFEVIGVDILPQPHYPFDFYEGDAIGVLRHFREWASGDEFAAIHASPPCQRYIRGGNANPVRHPDLLAETRKSLVGTGLPWIIENVPGAPMRPDVVLCGSQFGLRVRRHRWFESSVPLNPWLLSCNHSEPVAGVYGHPHGGGGAWRGMLPGTHETWAMAMGIDWMTTKELSAAIPPAYTEWLGRQLMAVVGERAA